MVFGGLHVTQPARVVALPTSLPGTSRLSLQSEPRHVWPARFGPQSAGCTCRRCSRRRRAAPRRAGISSSIPPGRAGRVLVPAGRGGLAGGGDRGGARARSRHRRLAPGRRPPVPGDARMDGAAARGRRQVPACRHVARASGVGGADRALLGPARGDCPTACHRDADLVYDRPTFVDVCGGNARTAGGCCCCWCGAAARQPRPSFPAPLPAHARGATRVQAISALRRARHRLGS
jgi:hypothetical protein